MISSVTNIVSSLSNGSFSPFSGIGMTSVQPSSLRPETSSHPNQIGKLTTEQQRHVEKMLKLGEEMFPVTFNVSDKQSGRNQPRSEHVPRRVARHVDSYESGYLIGAGNCVTMRNMTTRPKSVMLRNICHREDPSKLFDVRFTEPCGEGGVLRLEYSVIFTDVGSRNCSRPEAVLVTPSEDINECAHASYQRGKKGKQKRVTAENNCTVTVKAHSRLLMCPFSPVEIPSQTKTKLKMVNVSCAKQVPVIFDAPNDAFIPRSGVKPTPPATLNNTSCVSTEPTGYGNLIVENKCDKPINFGFKDPNKCGRKGIIGLPNNEKDEVKIKHHECYDPKEFVVQDAKTCQPMDFESDK